MSCLKWVSLRISLKNIPIYHIVTVIIWKVIASYPSFSIFLHVSFRSWIMPKLTKCSGYIQSNLVDRNLMRLAYGNAKRDFTFPPDTLTKTTASLGMSHHFITSESLSSSKDSLHMVIQRRKTFRACHPQHYYLLAGG